VTAVAAVSAVAVALGGDGCCVLDIFSANCDDDVTESTILAGFFLLFGGLTSSLSLPLLLWL
jgi:hypothetical protein